MYGYTTSASEKLWPMSADVVYPDILRPDILCAEISLEISQFEELLSDIMFSDGCSVPDDIGRNFLEEGVIQPAENDRNVLMNSVTVKPLTLGMRVGMRMASGASMVPLRGFMRPATVLRKVVLPQPLEPLRRTISPSATVRLIGPATGALDL